MNVCSVGDIIFGWYVGIKKMEVESEIVRYKLQVEVGDVMGNKGKVVGYDSRNLKLIEIIIRGEDVEEIKEGLEKAFNYYKFEFEQSLGVQMISDLKKEYEKNGWLQGSVYRRRMSCVGVELMHRDDMSQIINRNSIDNKEINKLGDNFVVIKLMERNFLKRFMKGKYGDMTKQDRNKLLTRNSMRLVFSVVQIEEMVN